MAGPPVTFDLQEILSQKERALEKILLMDIDSREAFILHLKKEADRLIQVNLDRCQETNDLLLHLAERTGNPLHRALGLVAQANTLAIGLGQYRQAVELYDQAAALYGKHGQRVEQAKTLIGKLYALSNLGEYEQALNEGEWARKVLRENREWYHLARLKVNMAIVYGRQGEDTRALELLDLARAAYSRLGAEGELNILRVEVNRAHVLRNLGRFQESIDTSLAVYEAHRKAGRTLFAARAQQGLAITYFLQGRFNEALALLDAVRETFLRDGRHRHAMLVELFMSDCLLQLRRFPEALEKCRQVRELFAGLGTRFEVGQAILNEGIAYIGLQRYAEAKESLSEARRLFEQESNQVAAAETDLQVSAVLLNLGQPAEALALAREAAGVFQAHNLPAWQARAFLSAARAALACGESGEQVSAMLDQALEISREHGLLTVSSPALYLRAQLDLQAGRPDQAMAGYEQAMEDLERLCGRLMIEYRASFIEDKERLYEDAVDLCLGQHRPEQGLAYAERAKSRALLDLLAYRLDLSLSPRSASDQPIVDELLRLRGERDRLYRRWEGGEGFGLRGETAQLLEEDVETAQKLQSVEKQITALWHKLLVRNADYARDAGLWQVRVEPVQPHLAPGCLVLEYFSVRGQFVAFLITQQSIQAVRLQATLAEVQSLLQFFWLNLRSVQTGSPERAQGLVTNMQGVLKKLYGLFVSPLADEIHGFSQIIVVPHGPLHYLPFHALFDGQAYLIEAAEISYLPGSSLLRYTQEMHPSGTGMLAVGSSYRGRLPFTVEEARSIASSWNGQALLEGQARLQTVRDAAPRYRLLHLAAHGEFRSDNPLFSGLALEDGWLTTLDIFNMRLNTSLVTLSACQTGRSVIGGGDELFGLMRAFLAAGAASLVATLWTVEDRSTAQLMQHFYAQLAAGARKGSALRQAQLQLLRDPNFPAHYRHPFFWAPFFLVGDPGEL